MVSYVPQVMEEQIVRISLYVCTCMCGSTVVNGSDEYYYWSFACFFRE